MISTTSGMLTDNFSLREMNHSGYAQSKGITNFARGYAAENQQWLAIVLQLIREEFGLPIRVTSSYRSERVNRGVGGARTSAHTHGSAADIQFIGVPANKAAQRKMAIKIADYFDSIGLIYDQIIWYNTWIHVGMR